jgi:hypothetical protein
VPALDEAGVGSSGSLRQKLEQHRSNAVCASCHDRMDTLGFGLENFDAIGRYRTHDGDFEIDSSGEMPSGERFVTPVELAGVLETQTTEFVRCLTEKLLTYSLGRGLERADRRTVDGVVARAAESENRFQTLIREIVESMPFQMRRGEAAAAAGASTEELARR